MMLFLAIASSCLVFVAGASINSGVLSGVEYECKHYLPYEATPLYSYRMCVANTDQEYKNGLSIIDLIKQRRYLPTCRVLHLMLWMMAESSKDKSFDKGYFVDTGANIGSCSVHMASLGFPVVALDPMPEHIGAIRRTAQMNPTFDIETHQVGVSDVDGEKLFAVLHGPRNWGSTSLDNRADATNGTFIKLRKLDTIMGSRRISLIKVDVEGYEFSVILGASEVLKRTPMLKVELVLDSYTIQSSGEVVSINDVLAHLQRAGFALFVDPCHEGNMYFGRNSAVAAPVDKVFGSSRYNIAGTLEALEENAKQILSMEINPSKFKMNHFSKRFTDVIAIKRNLADAMKKRFMIT